MSSDVKVTLDSELDDIFIIFYDQMFFYHLFLLLQDCDKRKRHSKYEPTPR